MSLEIIDCVKHYARVRDVPMMLIVSRNQVECAELGGGYVEGFTTSSFAEYCRRDGTANVLLARDHSGPYLMHSESDLEPEEALARTRASMRADIEAGFDIIHVDCSAHRGDVYEATEELLCWAMDCAVSLGRSVEFEVGTEGNVGQCGDPRKFQADLEFVTRLVKPKYAVAQTGSLVREVFQVGFFDLLTVRKLCDTAHSFGVAFKEHNVDYTSALELAERTAAGVDAINVGPEFGVTQTRTVVSLAQINGLHAEMRAFQRRAVESERWRKWVYGQPSADMKALIAGHYVYDTDEYRDLTAKLSQRTDLAGAIRGGLDLLLDHYWGGMN